MKKLVVAVIAGAFLASPVFAGDIEAEKAVELNKVAGSLEKFKDDPAKMDALMQKKECIERAIDLNELKGCVE